MTRNIFLNLPVHDLDRAGRFYEAIGGKRSAAFSNDHATAIALSDMLHVMLLTHDFYQSFTRKPIADAHSVSSMLVALSCDSRAEVDSMVERAVAAGGKADPGPVQDHGEMMYGRSFEDPDGHHWEPVWMAPDFAERGVEAFDWAAADATADRH